MIPNNNLSVLPWYDSIERQNARKWWVYNKVYPLFTPAGFMLPFQVMREHRTNEIVSFRIYKRDNSLVGDFTQVMKETGLKVINPIGAREIDVIVYSGLLPAFTKFANGQYYAVMSDGVQTWYSEMFTIVNDISGYLKLEWWDVDDFYMDEGVIIYKSPLFRNKLYLCADIAKPEYIFEEDGETRDGYFFPAKQISEKRYHFTFLASEYLLDVMRFVRMADYAQITKNEQVYKLDTFLITPEWEDNGDVASVDAEFDTATVAKKIGRGFVTTTKGDFNNDYNNDFLNT